MSTGLHHEKRAARKRMKAVLEKVSPPERERWSKEVAAHIKGLDEWAGSSIVLAFLPMPSEVDTSSIIEDALEDGKTVGVPRMYGPEIRFHRITGLQGPWERHSYGLDEPPASSPEIAPNGTGGKKVFVVTPGLCFDTSGWRLGFGRGYYDKFITRCRGKAKDEFFFAGVCFGIQIVSEVPTGEYDCMLDALVSERGLEYPAS